MTGPDISAAPKNKYEADAHRRILEAGSMGKFFGIHNVRGGMIAMLVLAFIVLGYFACKDPTTLEFFKTAGLAVTTLAIGYLAGDSRSKGSDHTG